MVSLSCARKGEPQRNLFTLHYPTGVPSELINFPDYITCILKAHRNLECNDFVPNGNYARGHCGTHGCGATEGKDENPWSVVHYFCQVSSVRRPLKSTFDMATIIFRIAGCPSYLVIFLNSVPGSLSHKTET